MYNTANSSLIAVRVLNNPSSPVASKFVGKPMRQAVNLQLPDNSHVAMWQDCPTIIDGWKAGQTQYVQLNSKGFYNAVESYGEANAAHVEAEPPRPMAANDPFNIAPPPVQEVVSKRYGTGFESVEPSEAVKQQVVDYMKFHTKVYASIFANVQKEMQRFGLDVKEEKDIATTVYIQTVRKFSI